LANVDRFLNQRAAFIGRFSREAIPSDPVSNPH